MTSNLGDDAIHADRDRWRAEALRLREAGQHMANALDAAVAVNESRSEVEEHLRAATASLGDALAKSRDASTLLNQALRVFMLPTDIGEN